MGEGDVVAAIGHALCAGMAGQSFQRWGGTHFTRPGMHANFLIHGIVGCLHTGRLVAGDLAPVYKATFAASQLLALPCLNADLYKNDSILSTLHLVSGVIPFGLILLGKEDKKLGYTIICLNLASLLFRSYQLKREWGYYTVAAGCFTYLIAPEMHKVAYPLGLAFIDYCTTKILFSSVEAPVG